MMRRRWGVGDRPAFATTRTSHDVYSRAAIGGIADIKRPDPSVPIHQ
jgi:hypothetical protein